MASMGPTVGQLNDARVVLHQRWEQSKSLWNDKVQRAFENECIAPLEAQLPRTRESMERLASVMAKIAQVVE